MKAEKVALKSIKIFLSVFRGIAVIITMSLLHGFKFIKFIFQLIARNNRVSKILKDTGYDCYDVMEKIEKLSPRDFEIFCCEMYKQLGYKATLTPASNDWGRDIILKKDKEMIFVECKHYSKTNKVGREILMKAYGSSSIFGADKTIVITTGVFTSSCYDLIKMVDDLEIIDSDDIIDILNTLKPISLINLVEKTLSFAS